MVVGNTRNRKETLHFNLSKEWVRAGTKESDKPRRAQCHTDNNSRTHEEQGSHSKLTQY
jgi:hypothetical protein